VIISSGLPTVLTRSKDRAEQEQIKEELAHLTFGD
jgi:hypothetical protein